MLSAPVQLLSQATSDVFYSRAADAWREGRLAALTSTTYSRLTQIAMPPMLVLVVGGPEIFVRAFGPAWHDAGVFSQWLAPWLYMEVVTAPLTSVFAVVERLGTRLAFESITLVIRLLAGGTFPGWNHLLAPLIEAMLWPVVTVMLLAPQRRAPNPDDNRPL